MSLRTRAEIRSGPRWRVWRGEDPDTRRLFLVKEVNPAAPRPDALARELAEEFRLFGEADHPNVLRPVSAEAPGRAVFADAQCSLAGYVDRAGPLAPDRVANVLLQAADALEHFHSRRLGHGSLTLHSLLVGPAGEVLLGDFLPHPLGGSGLPTPDPEPKYLAPELLAGRGGRWGRSTDLYALGYAALELLTGGRFDRLFALTAGAGLLAWHADSARQLSDWRGTLTHVPVGLLDVIAGLIPKDPSARTFPSAARLGETLRQSGLTSERRLAPLRSRVARPPRAVRADPGEPAVRAGGFTLGRVLHKGAGGSVYLGRWDEKDGRPAAVRILGREAVPGRAEMNTLATRLVGAGRVRDRNLVGLYRSGPSPGPDGGVWYAAAEYLPEGSLRSRLAAGHLLTPRAAARMAVRLARGLAALHAAGFVHGHLDPGCVLFDRAGRAKVADYWLPPPPDPAGGGPYRPPEQRAGAPPDPRWDVHALGVVLAEVTSSPDAPGWEAPAWLKEVIRAATHPDPASRIPTAAEFARRLREAAPRRKRRRD